MEKQDRNFSIALLIAIVVSGAIVYFSVPIVNHIAYARLENPATYAG